VDLGLTVGSSLSILISTSLGIWTQLGFPTSTVSGDGDGIAYGCGAYDPQEPGIPLITPRPEVPSVNIPVTSTGVLNWVRLGFNLSSLCMEVGLWYTGWSANAYNKWFKGVAVLLKSIDCLTNFGKLYIAFGTQLLNYITDFTPLLSPIANNLNALCGAIDFFRSDKKDSDGAALAVSICGFLGAVLDGITVVATATKQPDMEVPSAMTSLAVNLTGCLGGSIIVYCLKEKEKSITGEKDDGTVTSGG